jgi:predicted N-acetyltransferase YhbS
MNKNVIIRQEQPTDYRETQAVVRLAFETMPHADGDEHELVEKLRASPDFIPFLSLVAELNGKIIGHILFSKTIIGSETALTMAPVSVLPKFQNQGIGGSLIKAGHTVAKNLGYKGIVVLGHENYYPKFGYTPASNYGITCPFDVPDINFMAIELVPDGLKDAVGEAQHPKEFFD